jgi:hypothetical protein
MLKRARFWRPTPRGSTVFSRFSCCEVGSRHRTNLDISSEFASTHPLAADLLSLRGVKGELAMASFCRVRPKTGNRFVTTILRRGDGIEPARGLGLVVSMLSR